MFFVLCPINLSMSMSMSLSVFLSMFMSVFVSFSVSMYISMSVSLPGQVHAQTADHWNTHRRIHKRIWTWTQTNTHTWTHGLGHGYRLGHRQRMSISMSMTMPIFMFELCLVFQRTPLNAHFPHCRQTTYRAWTAVLCSHSSTLNAYFCQNNQPVTFKVIFLLPVCNLQRWSPKDGCQLIKSSTYYNLSTDKINRSYFSNQAVKICWIPPNTHLLSHSTIYTFCIPPT